MGTCIVGTCFLETDATFLETDATILETDATILVRADLRQRTGHLGCDWYKQTAPGVSICRRKLGRRGGSGKRMALTIVLLSLECPGSTRFLVCDRAAHRWKPVVGDESC